MPSTEKPDPSQWTLRFKSHRTTILLFVTPTASLTSIKSSLLSSIRATGVKSVDSQTIPSSPEEVILGVLVDRNDRTRGWVDLLLPENEDGDEGKKKGGTVKKGSIINESPLGAGLRDGDVIAFKFGRKEEGWDVTFPSYEEEDAAEEGKMET